jgi:hypothetical protein
MFNSHETKETGGFFKEEASEHAETATSQARARKPQSS